MHETPNGSVAVIVFAASPGTEASELLEIIPKIRTISPKIKIICFGMSPDYFKLPQEDFIATYQSLTDDLHAKSIQAFTNGGVNIVYADNPQYSLAKGISAVVADGREPSLVKAIKTLTRNNMKAR